jgi:hypothetical protein
MQLNTEIEIDAPAERVWQELLAFDAYSEWNPFITRIAGRPEQGAELDLTFSLPEGGEYSARPMVIRVNPGQELRWHGKSWLRGLFDTEHWFRLQPLGEQRTRFVHGQEFKGLLLKLMERRLTLTARGCVYMNQALKRRVEQQRAAG